MRKRLISAFAHNNFMLRMYMACNSIAHALENAAIWDYLKATLWVVASWLVVVHPFILFTVIIALNPRGNVLINYALLALFVCDAIAAFIGGVWVDARRKGEV